MPGLVPLIRVNYTIAQIFKSLFVAENTHKYRDRLSDTIKQYFSVDKVVLTASCRTGIYLLLKSLPQNNVMLPAYTCGVVVEAAKLAGKDIHYVDVDLSTFNVEKYENIDSNTIVIATHQYGLPCDIESLAKECKEKNAVLIEDCAGSFGSKVNNRFTGTFGDYGVFSFSASKTIQVPTKGGFIISANGKPVDFIQNTCKNDKKFKLMHSLKGIGFCLSKNKYLCGLLMSMAQRLKKRDNNEVVSHMEDTYSQQFYEWQAYIALFQLDNLEFIISKRKSIIERYQREITNPLFKMIGYNADAVYIRAPLLAKNRDSIIAEGLKNGIEIGNGYEKVYYSKYCSIADFITKNILYIPISALHSPKEIDKVIKFLNNFSI